MGMMAVAAASPACTDSRLAPRSSQSSTKLRGLGDEDSRLAPRSSQSSTESRGLGDEEHGESTPTKATDPLWKSEDTASTRDDLSSSPGEDREHDGVGSTDYEGISTDAEGEDSEGESEDDSGLGGGARCFASANELGFTYEEELKALGKDGLVAPLASVLTHLASLGSGVHQATIFHASAAPEISVYDYLARIAKYYYCSNGCLILGLIYIDRLLKMHPEFVVSALNIHRLLSTSIMLAAKFNDDVFYSNKYYGKVAGVRVSELNVLEENFLRLLNWRLHVLPHEYDEYLGRVLVPMRAAETA